MTPWSTEAAFAIQPGSVDGTPEQPVIVVSLFLSLDPGPLREFREFLQFDLDEAHATEMVGKLTLALRDLRERTTRSPHAEEAQS